MMIAPSLRCSAVLPELIKYQGFETIERILEQTRVFKLVILSDEMITGDDSQNKKKEDGQDLYRSFFPYINMVLKNLHRA
jgi:hypothetical protein